jgi:hypothetical protein
LINGIDEACYGYDEAQYAPEIRHAILLFLHITIIILQAIISEILSPRALSVNNNSGFSPFYLQSEASWTSYSFFIFRASQQL